MSELALPLSLFVAGLASGLHCAGMCGGVAAGFTVLQKDQLWKRALAFNLGRITTYAAAGAAAGTVGAGAFSAAALPAQTALYVLASLVLVLAGLHLAGFSNLLSGLGKLAMPLWRRVQPHAARLLALRPFAAGSQEAPRKARWRCLHSARERCPGCSQPGLRPPACAAASGLARCVSPAARF